jgi:glycosyltransferase involved in cell wall biosynthesis
MDITVIVCTYNRCQVLATCLRSLAASKLSSAVEWEVLVIDNNSNDQTRDMAQEFCRQYPGRFRYLFEPKPGKSYALNSGIRDASGKILAFTDDDLSVEVTWLANLTKPLLDPQYSGVGGRTLPKWKCTPPAWLPLADLYALAPAAIFDPGGRSRELMEAPFGNNMALRKELFEQHGGFRTDLGPSPGGLVCGGEDTELGERLLAAGERFWYESSAVVYHPVGEDRMRQEYFLAWWFDKARAGVRAQGVPRGTKWFLGPIPAYLFRRLVVWTLRWMLAIRPSRRFEYKLKVWRTAGEIVECYRGPRHGS